MANPSVTYTFANSTTADATQVNQNFTDLIDSLTDGTKDLSVAAITAAGAVSFQGNVTLGNGTPDDITVSGSLASSIPVKTTNIYDIGTSSIGLRSIYFGSSDTDTTRVIGTSAISAAFTLTLPPDGGSSQETLISTDGSGTLDFAPRGGHDTLINHGLAFSSGAGALTIALKQADGSTDPASGSGAVVVGHRSTSNTTGGHTIQSFTSSASVVIPATATLGMSDGVADTLWIYAIYDGTNHELAVSSRRLLTERLVSTTAISTAADSYDVPYSTSARTSCSARLLGVVAITPTTAGTWDSTEITSVTLDPANIRKEYGSTAVPQRVTTDGGNPGSGGVSKSTSTGSFTGGATSFTDITNATCTLTCTGRPVLVFCQPTGTVATSGAIGGSGTGTLLSIKMIRDSTDLGVWFLNTGGDFDIPCGAIMFLDIPSAGSHTYKLQYDVSSSDTCNVTDVTLVAVEL